MLRHWKVQKETKPGAVVSLCSEIRKGSFKKRRSQAKRKPFKLALTLLYQRVRAETESKVPPTKFSRTTGAVTNLNDFTLFCQNAFLKGASEHPSLL